MDITWHNMHGLDVDVDNNGDTSIKLYCDYYLHGQWYDINSITVYRYKGYVGLHYTYYDSDMHHLNLFNKSGTEIANLGNCSDYEKDNNNNESDEDEAEKYLLDFGRGLAKHLCIQFICYSRNGFRCCSCLKEIGREKISYETFNIDKKIYHLDGENFKHINGRSRGRVNGDMTIDIRRYNEKIREYMYCDRCINKIRTKLIDEFEVLRERMKNQQI